MSEKSNNRAASRNLAVKIAELAEAKKGEDIAVLDLRDITDFTDYFVIISSEIGQHLKSISDNIVDELKKGGMRPHHVEGVAEMSWILIDYIDVVVHLQLTEIRRFYDLEALWGEAERVKLKFDAETSRAQISQ